MRAYRCVSLRESTVVLEEQEGIAAHVPVLLQGEPGTYTFMGTPQQGGSASYTSGLLTGVMQAETITAGYVLQTQGGATGFYAVNPEKPLTVPAGRCYLQAEADVKVLNIVFPEDATSLNEELRVKNEELEGVAIYNLAGQMVNGRSVNGKLSKGIYIRGGKKRIVK